MGIVYKAREETLDRPVALKVLAPEICRDRQYIERFQREARSAARLSHPGIVPIYAYGEEAGRHFFAMEYVRGVDLAKCLETKAQQRKV